eukprot:maker-scaffold_3-snap-gene-17.0-mRNA-1 protein AED:0.01 eAED:0.01 QI:16/1/1/1/0.5/0.33/3/81/608
MVLEIIKEPYCHVILFQTEEESPNKVSKMLNSLFCKSNRLKILAAVCTSSSLSQFPVKNESLENPEKESPEKEVKRAPSAKRKYKRRETLNLANLKDNNEKNRLLERSLGLSRFEKNKQLHYYDYLVIGGGTTASAAVQLLRSEDPEAKILIVGKMERIAAPDITEENNTQLKPEFHGIFDRWRRPHTSHLAEMAKGKNTDALVCDDFDSVRIDPVKHIVQIGIIGLGHRVKYGSCLVAPAGNVRPQYLLDPSCHYSLREHMNMSLSKRDFKDLEEQILGPQIDLNKYVTKEKKVILVVGGGFVGTEVAASLAALRSQMSEARKKLIEIEIHQVYFEQYNLSNYFPSYLAKYITRHLQSQGVISHPLRLISDVKKLEFRNMNAEVTKTRAQAIFLNNNTNEKEELPVDQLVLASTRVDPVSVIGENSGLEVDKNNGGIVANRDLEAYRDLFVAGTSVSFFSEVSGRTRTSVYDHAMNSGLQAARNMLAVRGLKHKEVERYDHLPSFESVVGPRLKFNCVGEVDSRLKTVGVWLARRDNKTLKPLEVASYNRGVVYYIRDNRIVGIVCVNAPELLQTARKVLFKQYSVNDLKHRIRLGPDSWLRVHETN